MMPTESNACRSVRVAHRRTLQPEIGSTSFMKKRRTAASPPDTSEAPAFATGGVYEELVAGPHLRAATDVATWISRPGRET